MAGRFANATLANPRFWQVIGISIIQVRKRIEISSTMALDEILAMGLRKRSIFFLPYVRIEFHHKNSTRELRGCLQSSESHIISTWLRFYLFDIRVRLLGFLPVCVRHVEYQFHEELRALGDDGTKEESWMGI